MEAIVFWVDATLTVQLFLKLGNTISEFVCDTQCW